MAQPTQLLYLLHSGNLYGTERMALVTLEGLRDQLQPVLFAPPGPVHAAAQAAGIATHVFNGSLDLLKWPHPHSHLRHRRVAFADFLAVKPPLSAT
jgi:hypothetical protein